MLRRQERMQHLFGCFIALIDTWVIVGTPKQSGASAASIFVYFNFLEGRLGEVIQ